LSRRESEFISELCDYRGQDFAIGLKLPLLGAQFELALQIEQGRVIGTLPMCREHLMQHGEYAGLPVDQGAVAIKGEDFEAREVNHAENSLEQNWRMA
jgi:hypothetical protein